MISANKGEWSELYVLLKLLGEQKIYAGDGDLNKLATYYPILKILRDELERKMGYEIDKDVVVLTEDDKEFVRIPSSVFLQESKDLLKTIQEGALGKGAFEIPSMELFLKKIHCEKVKAKSKDKSDIHLVIHDFRTGMRPNLGFSIKSDVGAAPTLFNASDATRFVFEIKGHGMDDKIQEDINSINTRSKAMDRVAYLCDKGLRLELSEIPSSAFNGNLIMIDSNLPSILSWMLQNSYANSDLDLLNSVKRIKGSNPLNYDIADGHDFYTFKLKSFLMAVALGMLPATPWNGLYEATGGYIVVKEDGDIICFHIYNRNFLEDYLLKNTKFETPSTTRHNFGYVYKEHDKYYFDLVMQIRFK